MNTELRYIRTGSNNVRPLVLSAPAILYGFQWCFMSSTSRMVAYMSWGVVSASALVCNVCRTFGLVRTSASGRRIAMRGRRSSSLPCRVSRTLAYLQEKIHYLQNVGCVCTYVYVFMSLCVRAWMRARVRIYISMCLLLLYCILANELYLKNI